MIKNIEFGDIIIFALLIIIVMAIVSRIDPLRRIVMGK